MATHSNQQQKHWYNDGELFRQGLAQSNYITAITDWFMSLAGKATVLVLYFTVLYSCIQLYPRVNLPEGLSLAVFIIQMGALDIGGLSLGTLARQARKDGHPLEAKQAAWLSKALIAIMLLGVVTVSIGHVVTIEAHWFAAIQIIQVIARSIGAVLYGRVVHDLKHETTSTMVPVSDMFVRVAETEQRLTSLFTERLNTQEQAFTRHLEMLVQHMEEREQTMLSSLSQFQMETRQNGETISQQFSYETSVISEHLSSLISQINSLHISQETEKESDTISQESDTESDEEVSEESEEGDEPEAANDADGAKVPGRKYYVTFEAASELTGLSVLQLKRRVNLGEIEVNSYGKVRVKSLDNLQRNPTKKTPTKSKETQTFPALQLVKKA